MEVGYPGTQGLELPIPNPCSKNIPKSLLNPQPSHEPRLTNPAPTQAPVTQSQGLSGITIINNNNITTKTRRNNNGENTDKLIIDKEMIIEGDEGGRKH